MFDFLDFVNRQNNFEAEIDPLDCLRKKLAGKSSISVDQWIDIFLLAIAGARQSGATDSEIAMMLAGLYSAADAIDAQATEIDHLREAQAWQPIETAPTDGSTVVLRSWGGHIANGYWLQAAFNGCGAWIWPYGHSEPVYWMPLPAAPGAPQEPK